MARTIRQKLTAAKRKLTKLNEDIQKIIADNQEQDINKLKVQKSKLELYLQEFKSLVELLEKSDNDETAEENQLTAEFEELDEIADSAHTTLIELGNRLEVLNEEIAKEKRLQEEAKEIEEKRRLEQQEKEEKLRRETLERERHEQEKQLQIRKMEMEQENERMKIELHQKLEMEKLQIEKMKIESESKVKTTEIETRLKSGDITERSTGNSSTALPIRLPKLDISKFDGNILKWQEFWDSFEASIHHNPALQDIDKFNYLRGQLRYEAKDVIAGLDITTSNYPVAVGLLKERYGKKQLIINTHYSQLRDIPVTSTFYEKLRNTYDQIERHLRSLESLGENIDNNLMISLIQSKLPRNILAKLEEYKNSEEPWTVDKLRKELKKYIAAQETGDRLTNLYKKADDRKNHKDDWKRNDHKSYQERHPTGAFAASERSQPICFYCNQSHWSDECKEYPDVESRKKKAIGRCFICLKSGHLLKKCKSMKPCIYCKKTGNHHRSLCPNQFSPKLEVSNSSITSYESNLVAAGQQVVMQTALVKILNPAQDDETTNQSKIRMFLDGGSQRTYLSEELATKLHLKHLYKNFLTVYTFGTTKPKTIETPVVEIGIVLKSGFVMNMKANVVPNVTGKIERRPIAMKSLKQKIQEYDLADILPEKLERCSIDLLVGMDYYNEIVSTQRIKLDEGLYLTGSKVGWIICGKTEMNSYSPYESSLLMITNSSSKIATSQLDFIQADESVLSKPNIEDFWKLETIGIKDSPDISDDHRAIQEFNKSIQLVNNRYQVRWPWREQNPELPDNYQLSYGRLNSVVKRLKENPGMIEKYNDVIQDQLKKGMIEKVNTESVQSEMKHYIPHHGVITPNNNTTKLRIVYDASAKVKKSNMSLNECLYRGPVILEDLCALLMRFRTYNVAMVADIEKAFLQIGLQEQDRDVTRFLWLKDINRPVTSANLETLRFTRIPFGVIASQFILGATILHHLRKKDTPVTKKLAKDIYVDNLITGAKTDDEAIKIYDFSKETFKEMSMNLREWASNSPLLQQKFRDQEECLREDMKVLGLNWNIKNDNLNVMVRKSTKQNSPTKREVLKETAAVFDPLGFFTPVLLNAKLFLRKLWDKNMDWDDPLNHQECEEWRVIQKDLEEIKQIKIPRFVGSDKCKLLCFTDASGKAYGTTIYLQSIKNGSNLTNLIFSKSRIAPKKDMSLPRLELLGVLIGVRSLKFVATSLQLESTEHVLWTDSQCVLHWIKSNRLLTPFVRRRINEIKSGSQIEFRYVKSSDNPADIASRGRDTKELSVDKLWWNGPTWLNDEKCFWPTWNFNEDDKVRIDEILKEIKDEQTIVEISTSAGEGLTKELKETKDRNDAEERTSTPFGIVATNYSSMLKLLRITAWANRFTNNTKLYKKLKGPLTAKELEIARHNWIKHVQKKEQEKSNTEERKSKNNTAIALGLKLDQNGIIRCHGRFANANLPDETKAPIYLPRKSYWTELLVKEFHEKLFHAGSSHTLSQLRNQYWIPQGRNVVKNIIFRCGTCRKYHGGPFRMPKMSPWPEKKLMQSAPFNYTGLDYLGPFYIKEKPTKKIWICLFTCVAVRALHLEIVNDMSAEHFLMALRRFIARRGKPEEIILDNAPQFKLTKTTVDKAWQTTITDESVYNYTSNNNIKWKFIVEFAPWMGGFYERMVGVVKSSLRKAIGKKHLTEAQFTTFTTEAEGIINSRPLVYVDDDINSTNAITPMHFLSLIPKNGTPAITNEDDDDPDFKPRKETSSEELLAIWKKGQIHLDHLWKIWHGEYLLSLRERYQNSIKSTRVQSKLIPKIGQIVHIKEEINGKSLPRGIWKMGKITKLIESKDNEIRAATILLPTKKEVNRPINLLYPLETATPTDQYNHQVVNKNLHDNEENRIVIKESSERTKRKAAITAREKLKHHFADEIGTFVWCQECREDHEIQQNR